MPILCENNLLNKKKTIDTYITIKGHKKVIYISVYYL